MAYHRTSRRAIPAVSLAGLAALLLPGCMGYDSHRGAYDVTVVNVQPEIVSAETPVFTAVPEIAEAPRRD
ncbi:MAG: hypothetical protein RLN60_02955 [Phycisphaerales bacterium]